MSGASLSSPLLSGRVVSGPISARIRIDDRDFINFFGAGYLALSATNEIRDAVRKALESGEPFGQSVPAALRAIDPIFESVERGGAAALGVEASVYFASGYQIGNVGLESVNQHFDVILLDELAHYNLNDAAKLRARPTYKFQHCDADSLKEVLKREVGSDQRPLVVTDGVFATSGRVPPLADYGNSIESSGGWLFIDESHAFGVVGENGRGAAEYCGIDHSVTVGATLSKAICAQGALVGCSAATAFELRSKPMILGASAGSPLLAAAASASLSYVAHRPELRRSLQTTAGYLRRRVRALGLHTIDTPAPIVSFQCGTWHEMQHIQHRAFERGIYIHLSSYIGAGPEGTIRCAVFRDHSREDIDALVDVLAAVI